MNLRRKAFEFLTEGSAECADCQGSPALFYVERPTEAHRKHEKLCGACAERARCAGENVVPRWMLAPFQP